jgi:hypothetical protein
MSDLQRQCAAVKTQRLLIKVPPQKWPPRRLMDTSQGNSPGRALSPPTILEVAPRSPQGTSATVKRKTLSFTLTLPQTKCF